MKGSCTTSGNDRCFLASLHCPASRIYQRRKIVKSFSFMPNEKIERSWRVIWITMPWSFGMSSSQLRRRESVERVFFLNKPSIIIWIIRINIFSQGNYEVHRLFYWEYCHVVVDVGFFSNTQQSIKIITRSIKMIFLVNI